MKESHLNVIYDGNSLLNLMYEVHLLNTKWWRHTQVFGSPIVVQINKHLPAEIFTRNLLCQNFDDDNIELRDTTQYFFLVLGNILII